MLFQTANNNVVMTDIRPDQRGVISGTLNLSRNLGVITGASIMGAGFAFALATSDITTAHPEAVATGMRVTFAVEAILTVVALAIALGPYRRTFREGVMPLREHTNAPGNKSFALYHKGGLALRQLLKVRER